MQPPSPARAETPAFLLVLLRLIPAILLGGWACLLAAEDSPSSFLDGVNLVFHEAGHVFLLPFGRTLHFLGGTIFQLGIPLLVAFTFARRRQPLGAACCIWWMGQSLLNVSIYMADARDLRLELVGGGEHDWNELFYRFGLLGEDSVRAVSATTHHLGVLVMLAASGFLAWRVVGRMVFPERALAGPVPPGDRAPVVRHPRAATTGPPGDAARRPAGGSRRTA